MDSGPPDSDLPGEVDVVVIGGGIVGCAAAFWLVEQGYRVALCEKGRIAGEQSSRNWGWVRRMGRDRAEYPLGIASLHLWDGMKQRLGAETGFRRGGVMYTATKPREMQRLHAMAGDAEHFGIGAQMLTPAAVRKTLPGLRTPVLGGLYTADDGRAEPAQAAPAMARAAQERGAAVLTGCAVRGIERQAGRVAAVVTERGRIATRTAILASGAWSRLFAGNLGIDLPALRIRSSAMRTAPLQGGPEVALGNERFGLRPRLDGGYTLARRGHSPVQITPDAFRLVREFLPGLRRQRGEIALTIDRSALDAVRTPRSWALDAPTPFERCRVLDPKPQRRMLDQAVASVAAAFPAFREARIAERWGGVIDVTPDGVPIIDTVPECPGLVVATGFSGHGFGIGPAAGQLAGQIAVEAAPLTDPGPFRLARFRRKDAGTREPTEEG